MSVGWTVLTGAHEWATLCAQLAIVLVALCQRHWHACKQVRVNDKAAFTAGLHVHSYM